MTKRILIIDDDEAILEALKICLEEYGYQVETSSKVNIISRIVTATVPNLIIVDYLLSGTDGTCVIKKIRKNSLTKKIPVIMMSAHPDASNASKESGANAFIAKPFDLEYVLSLIRKLA